ncbi:MAG: transporter substrate-binding domain-containing protein [Alphaproteobacteria bacterium]|nr:transporter substrate-binding domain-containing protein [Alphaproteobacteria bacterium]
MKRLGYLILLCAFAAIGKTGEAAPTCSQTYTVVAGDSLSKIAKSAYSDANLWPYIYGYSSNATAVGGDPSLISIGITLNLPPCPQPGQAAVTAPVVNDRQPRAANAIEALTAGDYAPFTDQNWQNGGMLTDIVHAALGQATGTPSYSIDWVNDWSAHIDPLLRRHKYDMGFPWFKPNCDEPETLPEEDLKRCEFYFSEPLFDMLIVLFKRSDDTRQLASDRDLHGTRLCRPAGYFTFDLTERGLTPGETIELEQPKTVGDCFHKLVDGDVDFVALNQFTGQSAIREFGYGDVVTASEQLADTLGLHLIIHRGHPNATALLRQFDAGLSALRRSGRYDEIVGRHLAIFHGQNS